MNSRLSHDFHDLGRHFSRPVMPEVAEQPGLLLWNQSLAEALQLNITPADRSAVFSGSQLINGSKPVAMAYSGHQFGQFNPQLGDGRAHLLGEITAANGRQYDLHLKGSGRTPFSRNGDGKCAIKPAVREFLMSEAMHGLGVPTCRTLAVVTTGETVFRERPVPGAVVTRTAESHIRIGTFEHFAARGQHSELATLVDFCHTRHAFNLAESGAEKYLNFLSQVIEKQINLSVNWMRVGFIHGVMNTDNCLLSGHTIDYGPCAMLGVYDPATVFSSIDRQGRYAFGNQPAITHWNLARLAECLLPLIDTDTERAIEQVMPLIEGFGKQHNQAYQLMLAGKLGFALSEPAISQCADDLLKRMHQHELDHTNTFAALTYPESGLTVPEELAAWRSHWQQLLQQHNITMAEAQSVMQHNNPLVIPRNHWVERLLSAVEASGDVSEIERFLVVMQEPYRMTEHTGEYLSEAPDKDQNYQTFCGT
jgi:uncharacterized protein YdiU (UPF0061 family)